MQTSTLKRLADSAEPHDERLVRMAHNPIWLAHRRTYLLHVSSDSLNRIYDFALSLKKMWLVDAIVEISRCKPVHQTNPDTGTKRTLYEEDGEL